jgi:hypothetical protein
MELNEKEKTVTLIEFLKNTERIDRITIEQIFTLNEYLIN